MLDEDTIEVFLGEGEFPGTEETLTLPVTLVVPQGPPPNLVVPEDAPPYPGVPPLPSQWMADPILEMAEPKERCTFAFEAYFGRRKPFIPGRPLHGPRVPITWRNHVLAGLASAVILASVATYIEVHSGWRADMPQARHTQEPRVPYTAAPVAQSFRDVLGPALSRVPVSQNPVPPVVQDVPVPPDPRPSQQSVVAQQPPHSPVTPTGSPSTPAPSPSASTTPPGPSGPTPSQSPSPSPTPSPVHTITLPTITLPPVPSPPVS